MSENDKSPECGQCKKLENYAEASQKCLMLYIESEKEFITIPLSGGRLAKIEIKGALPVTVDDIVLMIAHMQLVKRTFSKASLKELDDSHGPIGNKQFPAGINIE